jgi:hypothetical protein
MNTTKSVYNRLFAEDKVELGKHQVSLATTDEIASQLKSITQALTKFNKLDATVQKNIKPLNDAYKEIVLAKDYAKKKESVLAGLEKTLTKQANDLGIDVKQLPAWKNLMDAYSFTGQVNDAVMNSMDAIKTIGK